ncbi:imidazoleglycerol-phosphate dehydratase HisB [Asticcacaulis sp. ZE23SCel15]|uniref:imidazoleglycerol-phosphate dehydratase HisB n=1 Tax=Asticcacaulis sp. ZE23SCel15 TaxID=3059027 RepID=UPI00265EFB45|nr:imidazoleglycerol-phosphate dehydratase HisB [Asticcacaulis sp. ZE23SCel15]WKL55915.1 imidazoleglycerol-phosphate dehydratase HisB [Asticcacaulis sp. ZE23SCel15]
MFASPFSSLTAATSGLEGSPPSLEPLRERMAELYGVEPYQLLVTRGASHAMEILLRRLRLHGHETILADTGLSEKSYYLESLCNVYGLQIKSPPSNALGAKSAGLYLIDNPRLPDGKAWSVEAARALAVDIFPTLLVVDESYFDAVDAQSLVELTRTETNVIVFKSLSYLYGIGGARVGALIAGAKTLAGLTRFCEPYPLPTPSLKAAELVLSPSRQINVEARIALVRSEQSRLRHKLAESKALAQFELNDGPFIHLKPMDLIRTQTALKRFGISARNAYDGLLLPMGDAAFNDRILTALGVVSDAKPARKGEYLRDTKETRISVMVDLGNPKPISISTGVGFFDHMLDQVASHGGFSLQVACEGDLHIDAHHTVEDTMLAVGAALKQALGDRIGMARFGFVLPMDETEAKVSVDLGGRPFCVFKGEFEATHIGDYQTEMTAHAFRSLSETLGASIHVEVSGGNDHHKTEACFKALGRALRQATRIEGDSLPSTKGMLA